VKITCKGAALPVTAAFPEHLVFIVISLQNFFNIFPLWPIFPTEDAVLSSRINAKNRPVKEKSLTAENSVIARNFR